MAVYVPFRMLLNACMGFVCITENSEWRKMQSSAFVSCIKWRYFKIQTWIGNRMVPSTFWRVLTMVYNTQDYCFFLTFPSFSILETRKHDVSETVSVSVRRWNGGSKHLISWAELSRCLLPLFTWGRKQTQFPKRRIFQSLAYWMMEKSKKPSNHVQDGSSQSLKLCEEDGIRSCKSSHLKLGTKHGLLCVSVGRGPRLTMSCEGRRRN
jgi:hypothetical protein